MKIHPTKHCLQRIVERVKKIKSMDQTKKYANIEFKKIYKLYKNWDKRVKKTNWKNGEIKLSTAKYKFIYSKIWKEYHLITYCDWENDKIKRQNSMTKAIMNYLKLTK